MKLMNFSVNFVSIDSLRQRGFRSQESYCYFLKNGKVLRGFTARFGTLKSAFCSVCYWLFMLFVVFLMGLGLCHSLAAPTSPPWPTKEPTKKKKKNTSKSS